MTLPWQKYYCLAVRSLVDAESSVVVRTSLMDCDRQLARSLAVRLNESNYVFLSALFVVKSSRRAVSLRLQHGLGRRNGLASNHLGNDNIGKCRNFNHSLDFESP